MSAFVQSHVCHLSTVATGALGSGLREGSCVTGNYFETCTTQAGQVRIGLARVSKLLLRKGPALSSIYFPTFNLVLLIVHEFNGMRRMIHPASAGVAEADDKAAV
jgi:hypothetical protein